ncbi:hypothetical protein V1477_016826 [Vespula maculifrons]|uniref:Uncharacterized protein n=1 Tax=Vespula maculifrons TaxID=7453 RepID=A0ABD2B4A0_VESMC
MRSAPVKGIGGGGGAGVSSAKAETAERSPVGIDASGLGNCETSLVLKLLRRPSAEERTPQLRIRSFSSSNQRISGISAGLNFQLHGLVYEYE